MHKYTTTFDFEISACEEIGGINISNANLENLRSLIPTSVDLDKNVDLMGVAFNAAVVNEFNRNGDGMRTVKVDGVDYLIPSQGGVNISGVVDKINKLQFGAYDKFSTIQEAQSYIRRLEQLKTGFLDSRTADQRNENYDYIFHCAAYKHVDISENAGSLEEYYYNNYIIIVLVFK